MPAVTAAVAAVAARVDSPAGADKDKRRRARERPESQGMNGSKGAGETPSETYLMEQMGDWLAGLPPTMPFHRGQVTNPLKAGVPRPGRTRRVTREGRRFAVCPSGFLAVVVNRFAPQLRTPRKWVGLALAAQRE